MGGLRQAINAAFQKKYVPQFIPGDVRSLGAALGVGSPISVRNILAGLQSLPGLQMIFATGTLGPSTVTAFGQLMISSDGFWSFRGSIHESGAVGHNYALGMALLDLKDSSGQVVAFTNEGTAHGTLEPGSNDDSWQQNGRSQLIADNWEIAKNSRMSYDLEVETNPLDVILAVLVGALVAAAGVAIAILESDGTKCDNWVGISPDDKGQPGVEGHVR